MSRLWTLDQGTPDGLYRIVSVSFEQLFASIHRKIPQEHDGIPNIVLLVSFKLFTEKQKLKKMKPILVFIGSGHWNMF